MVEDALQKNYHRIKIKIKPGWDISVVEKVRHNQPGIPLMVDANGAYELPDLPHLKALDEYNLMMLEQPLSYDDYVDHRHLARELKTPVCLDEGIRSAQDARRAIELGSCRIINIKQARVGGAAEAIRVHDLCSKRGIPVWCGGLLESGIGRAHNLALAGLPNFTLPGDLSPSSRYYEKDIVEPPISMDKEGWIHLLDKPGIGYDVQERVLKDFCLAYERLVP
jgi:O-succinylbenzoate synthase